MHWHSFISPFYFVSFHFISFLKQQNIRASQPSLFVLSPPPTHPPPRPPRRQVIRGGSVPYTYGPECDLWSAGVILFILLGGYPPFFDESEPRLFKKIRGGRADYDDPVWAQARGFVSGVGWWWLGCGGGARGGWGRVGGVGVPVGRADFCLQIVAAVR